MMSAVALTVPTVPVIKAKRAGQRHEESVRARTTHQMRNGSPAHGSNSPESLEKYCKKYGLKP